MKMLVLQQKTGNFAFKDVIYFFCTNRRTSPNLQIDIAKHVVKNFIFAWGTAISYMQHEKVIAEKEAFWCVERFAKNSISCKRTQLAKYVAYCLPTVTCMMWSLREKTGNFEAEYQQAARGGPGCDPAVAIICDSSVCAMCILLSKYW